VTSRTVPIALGLVLARARWTPRGWAIESPTGQQVGSLPGVGQTDIVRAVTALRAAVEESGAEVGDVEVEQDLLTAYAPPAEVSDVDEPVYPAPGSTIPGQPGYVVGHCEHRVARSEWRAGFRVCERCPEVDVPDDDEQTAPDGAVLGSVQAGGGTITAYGPPATGADSRPAGTMSEIPAGGPAAVTTPGLVGGGDQGPGVALAPAMDSTPAGGGHELSPQPPAGVDPHRAATIAGQYALADWLAEHPDVPAPTYDTDILLPLLGDSDADSDAELQRIGEAIGTDLAQPRGTDSDPQRERTVAFGPVRYRIYYTPQKRQRQYRAETSYHGCVDPDPIEPATPSPIEPATDGLPTFGPTPPKLCVAMTPTRRGLSARSAPRTGPCTPRPARRGRSPATS
jgi:hypothetical protein